MNPLRHSFKTNHLILVLIHLWDECLVFVVFTIERTTGYTLPHRFFFLRKNMYANPDSDPKMWEEYFKSIVRMHYKPANYCDLPDTHGGDFGIECYTLNGHVFQCYRPEQFADVDKLVKAQRKKISNDIKKFTIDNVNDFKELFGPLKISRWILATPYNKSAKLRSYCSQKSLKVRALNLPYIDDDFQILIQTDKDYPQESFYLKKDHFQLSLDLDSTTLESAKNFIDNNIAFLEKLNLKLPKVYPDAERHHVLRGFFIQKYLDYQNLLDTLKKEWVDIYQIVYKCIQNRESNLVGLFILSPEAKPSEMMKEEISTLAKCISEEVPTFKQSDLEKITWGVISDWLIRCPLDF
ncbi:hypothetical protein ACSKQ6_002500 [Escherichia coli]